MKWATEISQWGVSLKYIQLRTSPFFLSPFPKNQSNSRVAWSFFRLLFSFKLCEEGKTQIKKNHIINALLKTSWFYAGEKFHYTDFYNGFPMVRS